MRTCAVVRTINQLQSSNDSSCRLGRALRAVYVCACVCVCVCCYCCCCDWTRVRGNATHAWTHRPAHSCVKENTLLLFREHKSGREMLGQGGTSSFTHSRAHTHTHTFVYRDLFTLVLPSCLLEKNHVTLHLSNKTTSSKWSDRSFRTLTGNQTHSQNKYILYYKTTNKKTLDHVPVAVCRQAAMQFASKKASSLWLLEPMWFKQVSGPMGAPGGRSGCRMRMWTSAAQGRGLGGRQEGGGGRPAASAASACDGLDVCYCSLRSGNPSSAGVQRVTVAQRSGEFGKLV